MAGHGQAQAFLADLVLSGKVSDKVISKGLCQLQLLYDSVERNKTPAQPKLRKCF